MPVLIISLLFLAFLVFLTAVSLCSVFAPRWLWRIMDSWKAQSTPSRAYFVMQRISGLVGVLLLYCTVVFVLYHDAHSLKNVPL